MWVTLLHHLTCMIYIPRKATPVMLLSAVIRILRFRSSTMLVVFEAVQVYLWDPSNREPRCATSVCSFASLLDGLITSLAMLLTNLGKWDVHELFSWETQCWIQYSSGSLSSLAIMRCKSSLFPLVIGCTGTVLWTCQERMSWPCNNHKLYVAVYLLTIYKL